MTRIWAHNTTGEKYALRINDAGDVLEAVGPLYYKDIPAFLEDDWDGDQEVAEWLVSVSDQFLDVTDDAE